MECEAEESEFVEPMDIALQKVEVPSRHTHD